MNDLIYDSIEEMPDDVLVGNIKTFEEVIAGVKDRANSVVIELMNEAIQAWDAEIEKRMRDGVWTLTDYIK